MMGIAAFYAFCQFLFLVKNVINLQIYNERKTVNVANTFNSTEWINENQHLLGEFTDQRYSYVLKRYRFLSFATIKVDKSSIYPIENDFGQVKGAIASLLTSNQLKVQSVYNYCDLFCQYLMKHQDEFNVKVAVGFSYKSFIYKVDIIFVHQWVDLIFSAMPIYILPDKFGLKNISASLCRRSSLRKFIGRTQLTNSKSMKKNLAKYCYIPLSFVQESSVTLRRMAYDHISETGVRIFEDAI